MARKNTSKKQYLTFEDVDQWQKENQYQDWLQVQRQLELMNSNVTVSVEDIERRDYERYEYHL